MIFLGRHTHSKRRRERKRRKKRAACFAALWYCAGVGLTFGMLRAAQQTKRVMYGGMPVLAEVLPSETASAYEVRLAGGEWVWLLPQGLPTACSEALTAAAEALPPGVCKWLLRGVLTLTDAATYTTERIQSTCSSWFCSR